MIILRFHSVALAVLLVAVPRTLAVDNELTPEEKRDGYELIFNGQNLDNFRTVSSLGYAKWIVEDGAIRTCLFGHTAKFVPPGHLFTAREYTNYVLKLDFKIPPSPKETHSGIILRVGGTPPNTEALSLEMSIYGADRRLGPNCTGSFRHELLPPTKTAVKTDGGWNSCVITVNQNIVEVVLNFEKVNRIDLDEWDTPGKRPDGTAHQLRMAPKDLPRKGPIGLRDDHGSPVWFKNIKLKPLP